MVLRLLIVAVVAPGLVAGSIALAARRLPESARLRRGAALAALALGYATAHLGAVSAPSFPPIDTTQGLFYLAVLAAVLGVAVVGAPASSRRAARLATTALMLGLTLHPLVRYQWSRTASIVGIVTLGTAALASWWLYAALAARLSIGAVRAAWIVLFAAVGLLLVLARTALLGQLAAAVALSLLVIAVASPPSRGDAEDAAALFFLAPMLHALVLNGLFYAELGAPAAIAAVLAPLAAAAALAAARRGPMARVAAAALGVVLVLSPFVGRAAIAYIDEDRGYSEYEE